MASVVAAGRSAGGLLAKGLPIPPRSEPRQKQAPLPSPWTGRYRTRPSAREDEGDYGCGWSGGDRFILMALARETITGRRSSAVVKYAEHLKNRLGHGLSNESSLHDKNGLGL